MKKIFIHALVTFLFFSLFNTSLAAQTTSSQTNNDSSLYARMGRADAIESLLNEAFANMATDRTINIRFVKTDIKTLKANWNNIICNKTGGKCDLPVFSEKFKASDPEWEAGIGDIKKALNRF